MAEDPTQTVVADTGLLYVAPVGTAAPTDTTTALPVAWSELGLLAKDGLGLASNPQIQELFSFGHQDPTRLIKQRETKTFTAHLQQWNTASFTLAMNGGTVTVATGTATYTPPADTTLAEHALVFHFEDGTNHYRLHMPRVQVRSGAQMNFSDSDYSVLPLEVTLLSPTGGGAAFELITNNTAFTATP